MFFLITVLLIYNSLFLESQCVAAFETWLIKLFKTINPEWLSSAERGWGVCGRETQGHLGGGHDRFDVRRLAPPLPVGVTKPTSPYLAGLLKPRGCLSTTPRFLTVILGEKPGLSVVF